MILYLGGLRFRALKYFTTLLVTHLTAFSRSFMTKLLFLLIILLCSRLASVVYNTWI